MKVDELKNERDNSIEEECPYDVNEENAERFDFKEVSRAISIIKSTLFAYEIKKYNELSKIEEEYIKVYSRRRRQVNTDRFTG